MCYNRQNEANDRTDLVIISNMHHLGDNNMTHEREPQGELSIKTLAMPADTNPAGNIFGGWVVSQMDIAGLNIARRYTPHNVLTVAINPIRFFKPIFVGDFVCCYARPIKTGTTSITVGIETWALAPHAQKRRLVTEGVFVYVAVDEEYQPIPVIHNESE